MESCDEDDLGWDEPLPEVIVLTPDYGAELPLWGERWGNIDWHFTRLSRELLDRLAAWQEEFDDNFHSRDSGWRSASIGAAGPARQMIWQLPCAPS